MNDFEEVKSLFADTQAAAKSALDRIEQLDRRLTGIETRSARPGAPGLSAANSSLDEVKAAFVASMLTGRGIESKSTAATMSLGPSGGFGVPREIESLVMNQLRDMTPMRQVATVVQTQSADYRKLIGVAGSASGWSNETGARVETDAQDIAFVSPAGGELFAYPRVSRAMLEDAAFDVEAWLRESVATEFAVREGAAFVSGSGLNRPLGFLSGDAPTTQADSVRPFGRLQYIPTGAAGAFAASAPQDVLIDLVYTLRSGFRANASWMMNSSTAATVRKFKDAEGRFLWTDGLQAGQPPSLLGYPVILAEDMPNIAANSFAIAFGDFRRGYLITDRAGMTVVRDEVTQPGFVRLYIAKRVGGAVQDSHAIKLLRFATT